MEAGSGRREAGTGNWEIGDWERDVARGSPRRDGDAGERAIERALVWLRRRRDAAAGHGSHAGAIEAMSAPAFRAVVAARLRSLERDLGEVRARVNGLLFVVAGAVVTQVVLRVL